MNYVKCRNDFFSNIILAHLTVVQESDLTPCRVLGLTKIGRWRAQKTAGRLPRLKPYGDRLSVAPFPAVSTAARVARALMMERVLLFDEPTAALDRKYRSNRRHYS
ncbi:hypothetical protein KCP71_22825 [Salmonella enterica subsp. enterica]|nr:hypothetical protein KCP71_22825 [Salmonella enterica subsp. enterica]